MYRLCYLNNVDYEVLFVDYGIFFKVDFIRIVEWVLINLGYWNYFFRNIFWF